MHTHTGLAEYIEAVKIKSVSVLVWFTHVLSKL